MLNVHLSYKPPSYWRILFWSGVHPRQFSKLKKFRALVVPSGTFRKGDNYSMEAAKAPVFLCLGHSLLRRKGDITGSSFHEPIQSNSMYVQTVRRSIYYTRQPKHPHFPIRQYKRRLQGPTSLSLLQMRTCEDNYVI